MTPPPLIRIVHLIAGFICLPFFWLPAAAAKGGRAHRRFGWAYVCGMGAIAAAATIAGLYRFAIRADEGASATAAASLPLFVAAASASACWYGFRALRRGGASGMKEARHERAVPTLLLASGVALSLYGWAIAMPSLQYVPLLGAVTGGTLLRYMPCRSAR